MGLDKIIGTITDPYERQARLSPALLAGLPVIVMVTVSYGSNSIITAACTIAASCGCVYLLSSIARELGRRLEPGLFESWGGKPTTQLLRHRDKRIEGPTKIRYHKFLSKAVGLEFPSPKEEEANPSMADDIYQSAVRWLLNQTRDIKQFKMIFDENIAYGFRRNALGLKWLGIISCISTTVWVLIAEQIVRVDARGYVYIDPAGVTTAATISLTISAVMMITWLTFFTRNTVRNAAFVYAENLIRACEKLMNKYV